MKINKQVVPVGHVFLCCLWMAGAGAANASSTSGGFTSSLPDGWLLIGSFVSILILAVALTYRIISQRFKVLTSELEQSQLKLSDAQRIARMGSWSRDYETGEVTWSEEALRVLGLENQEQIKHYEVLVHPDDTENVVEIIAEAYHQGGSYECEHRVVGEQGKEKYIRLAGQVFLDSEGGEPVRELGTVQDITARKQAEDSIRRSEAKLNSILESAPYPIMILGLSTQKVFYANQSTYMLFEFPLDKSLSEIRDMDSLWVEEEDREKLISSVSAEEDIHNQEIQMKTATGRRFWALLSANVMEYGDDQALFVSMIDITEKKVIQQELERLATTDPLTGIYNRRSYFDMVNKELKRSVRYHHPFCLLMLDIDHFKRVNDTHGHAFGDQVIRRFAEVCNSCLREEDIFGRIGGEEFSVLLVAADAQGATMVAERIRQSWQDTQLEVNDQTVSYSVSIGVSELVNPREGIDMIMERADKALYVAKADGRNCVRVQALPEGVLKLQNKPNE